MIRVFLSKILRDSLSEAEKQALVAEFKSYKEGASLPENFGKDVPYDHPHTLPAVKEEDICHIHLNSSGFPEKLAQDKRTSDDHLVYCSNYYEQDIFLLMAILQPDAHEKAKDNSVMYNLAQMANEFRNNDFNKQ